MWLIAALLTLGAASLYRTSGHTSDEVAIACLPIAGCGLLVALVAAPWQVQLLMLTAVLLGYPAIKSRWS